MEKRIHFFVETERMKKKYCADCNNYRKFLNPKLPFIFDKNISFFLLFAVNAVIITTAYLKKK